MHPICEMKGCDEEVRGRVSVFAEGWGGGLYYGLCAAHLAGVVTWFPAFMDQIAQQQQ